MLYTYHANSTLRDMSCGLQNYNWAHLGDLGLSGKLALAIAMVRNRLGYGLKGVHTSCRSIWKNFLLSY
jgi:hypothetical protein